MKKWFAVLLVTFFLILYSITQVYAIPLEMDDFFRSSGPEYLSPQFDSGRGQTTLASYSGYIEVFVSGFGQNNVSLPNDFDDAFYHFMSSTGQPTGLFSNTLRVGTEYQAWTIPAGYTWHPNSSLQIEAGSVHVADLIVACIGDSFPVSGVLPLDVWDGFAPVYNPSHEYHFIMDLGTYDGRLTLGYGDGGTWDNSGNYDITLWRVQPVPEPATMLLLGSGFIGLVSFRKKLKK